MTAVNKRKRHMADVDDEGLKISCATKLLRQTHNAPSALRKRYRCGAWKSLGTAFFRSILV